MAEPPADIIQRGREEMAIGSKASRAAGVNTPRVSIGMPVWNGQEFIRPGIESLLGQTFSSFELIISDNASTDATQAICEGYAGRDKRIRYHRNDRNTGLQANFARVLHLANAPYFMWGCHDDQWDPTYVAKMVDVLDSRESVVLAGSNSASIDQDGVRRRDYDNVSVYAPRTTAARAHRFVSTPLGGGHATLIYGLMRTPIIQGIGYAPPRKMGDNNRDCAIDLLTLFRLIFHGDFYVANETLYFHRDVVLPGSECSPSQWIPNLARAAQEVHQYYGDLRRILRDSDLDARQETALTRAAIMQELQYYPSFARSLLAKRIRRH